MSGAFTPPWIALAALLAVTIVFVSVEYWRARYRFGSRRFQLAAALLLTTVAGVIDNSTKVGAAIGCAGALLAIRSFTYDRAGEWVWISCAIIATIVAVVAL